MNSRSGEKIGWIGGFSGGFLWLGVLSVLWIYQGELGFGIAGMFILAVSEIAIVAAAPWRWPNTAYWKLMLPVYGLFLASAALGACYYFEAITSKWQYLQLLPVLGVFIPLLTIGRKTWNRGR